MITEMPSTELVVRDQLNALDLFTGDAMDPLVAQIRDIVEKHVPDTSTDHGRREIASLARKVSSAKVILDDLGKDLVAGWKEKAKKVDIVRKEMRDELDTLRDYARAPLTRWEEEEDKRKKQEALDREWDQAWDEAHAEQALRERERIVREKEAEFARQEADQKAKAETERIEQERKAAAERAAQERKEREAQIAREAAERAKREAEATIQREKERAEKAERDKTEAEAREKARAEQAERDRIAAEARAKAEKEAAVRYAEQKAREEAARKEAERLAAEQAEKDRQEKLAANRRHREKVNREAMDSLVALHYNPDVALTLVEQIAAGKVRNVTVNY